MLPYNRFDVSESLDVKKTCALKECIICHHRSFLDKGFKFQSSVCNGCHDVLMMYVDINSLAILNIDSADYCCIINNISKSEDINLFKISDLSEKSGLL